MLRQDPDFDDPDGKRNRQNVIKIDMNSEYQKLRREGEDTQLPDRGICKVMMKSGGLTGHRFCVIIIINGRVVFGGG